MRLKTNKYLGNIEFKNGDIIKVYEQSTTIVGELSHKFMNHYWKWERLLKKESNGYSLMEFIRAFGEGLKEEERK